MDKGQKKAKYAKEGCKRCKRRRQKQKKDTHFSQSRNSWVSYSPLFPSREIYGRNLWVSYFPLPIFRSPPILPARNLWVSYSPCSKKERKKRDTHFSQSRNLWVSYFPSYFPSIFRFLFSAVAPLNLTMGSRLAFLLWVPFFSLPPFLFALD